MFSSGLLNNPIAPPVVAKRINHTSSTLGSEYIIADKAILPANHVITGIYGYVASGTPTVSFGSTSGGDDIAKTITLAEGWNQVAMIKPASSTLKLNVTSDSGNDIIWAIFYSELL